MRIALKLLVACVSVLLIASTVNATEAQMFKATDVVTSVNHMPSASTLCDFTCNPACGAGWQGTYSTPQHGWVQIYHLCDLNWYCLDRWCEPTEDLDHFVTTAQSGSISDLAKLVATTAGAHVNLLRHSLQLADCGGLGIGVNIPLSEERAVALAAAVPEKVLALQ